MAHSAESEAMPVLSDKTQRLSELEAEAIDICIRLFQLVGLPRSVGELYGLLFVSSVPLPMDRLMSQLNLSKGATSQGLKMLRAYGAIKLAYIAGDRRDHYVAETNLRYLVGGFLKERVEPGLLDLGSRLGYLHERALKHEKVEGEWIRQRVEKLQKWQRKAGGMLPVIRRILVG